VKGEAVDMPAPQGWDSLLVANYPHDLTSNEQAEDALTLYRKILVNQPDHSVTIISVGFFTNLRNLLNSQPDAISPLTGKQLVARKVKQLVSMAGRFDHEMGNFREFNVVKDVHSSQYVFDNWPGPILFSGFEIGLHIHTGLPIAQSGLLHSPVKDVFSRCIPLDPNDSKGRMSWDETAVLAAVLGPAPYFSTVKGKIIAHEDGSNGWDPSADLHHYLVQSISISAIENVLNWLIAHQPKP
jgi:inosine-uridine nucleoside N-ribohydrolase